jgi:hypothetical protein
MLFFVKYRIDRKTTPHPSTPHPPIKVGVVNLIKGETKIFNITELKKTLKFGCIIDL